MPKTPATIVAPTPTDSRVLLLADRLKVSRADAYFAVVEAWFQLSLEADDDGIVKGWTPATLEALVDLEAEQLGAALVDLGLVGVVNDGLVMPAELRRARGAADVGGHHRDDRRKASAAEASRRYRRKAKTLGKTLKSSRASSWRSLGRVAGHDVRAVDGEHGVYVVVVGARLGGETFRKFTTGDKSWTLEGVTLVDALPGLRDKWRGIHDREAQAWDASKRKTLEPSYEAFRDDCSRLLELAKLERTAAASEPVVMTRHHDGDDGDDASSFSSSQRHHEDERKSYGDATLNVGGASSQRHDDAPSSMSSMSSSNEEDMGHGGRDTDDARGTTTGCSRDNGSGHDDREARRWAWAGRVGKALGMTPGAVVDAVRRDPEALKRRLLAEGLDPNTGDPVQDGAIRGRTTALGAAGIQAPDLGVDRLADRPDQDAADRPDHAFEQATASASAVA